MNDLFNGLISLSQVAQLRWLSESCVEILDGGSLSVRQSYYIMLLSWQYTEIAISRLSLVYQIDKKIEVLMVHLIFRTIDNLDL